MHIHEWRGKGRELLHRFLTDWFILKQTSLAVSQKKKEIDIFYYSTSRFERFIFLRKWQQNINIIFYTLTEHKRIVQHYGVNAAAATEKYNKKQSFFAV